jgi:SAM-dependent methyltransferase
VNLAALKGRLPWWTRVAAKIVLSRLPAGYAVWQRLGLFRHGKMDEAGYASDVFDRHVAFAGLQGALRGKTILELGPGDSVATAVIAAAHGARAVLVDAGRFASRDLRVYAGLVQGLKARQLNPPEIGRCRDLDEMLAEAGARYLTQGLKSLAGIDAHSVDFICSQAVLEHVRRDEFLATQRECARILRPDGVCSHRVDLQDHLGGGLNNLRFAASVWESQFFARSGFYTNRIRFDAMIGLFEQAGFSVEIGEVRRWKEVPIARSKLAREFRDLSDGVLDVRGFDVLLRHAPRA